MIFLESIEIKPLYDISEFIQAVEVQKLAWNRNDYSLIPPTMFKSFVKNGGCVIGALVKQNTELPKVIGYVIGYLAINSEGKLYHHSQQVAVLPEYQQLGVAYKLKQAQKEYVQLHYDLDIMTWTVDPLLSKNAFLNYHKLGAIGRLYWIDYYGTRTDNLNSGLETDRIEVEWYFSDPESRLISEVKENIPNELVCFDYSDNGTYYEPQIQGHPYIGVCIPRDLVDLKEGNLELAVKLRMNFRKIALHLISNDYAIIDIKSKLSPKSILIWTNELKGIKKLKIIQ